MNPNTENYLIELVEFLLGHGHNTAAGELSDLLDSNQQKDN